MDLLVPSRCAGCQRDGPVLCADCRSLLGRPLRVRLDGRGQPPVYALGRYRGPLRTALLAYKERGRRELAGPLGEALAGGVLGLPADGAHGPDGPDGGANGVRRLPAGGVWGLPANGAHGPDGSAGGVRGLPAGGVWLVPVPSRSSAARRRGGDHLMRLAERTAQALAAGGVPAAVAPALRLASGVRDSVGLDAAARAANLAGRTRPRQAGLPPPGTPVVLLDDVATTGATAAACTAALAAVGVEVHAVLVIASAVPLLRTGVLRDHSVTVRCNRRTVGSMTA